MVLNDPIHANTLLEHLYHTTGISISYESTLCLLSVNYSSNCVNAALGSTRMANVLAGWTDRWWIGHKMAV